MNLIRKITNSHPDPDEEFVIAMKNILGYRPRKIEFYKEAFTHSSLKELNSKGYPMNYERLELAWGPADSALAFFRFTNVLFAIISSREVREETRPEVFSVLDLGLGEWLPGKATFPH